MACRFFFRLHQEDENKRRVEERKAQQRLEAEKRAQEQDDADSNADSDLDRTLELQNMRDNDDNDTFNRPLDSAAETDVLVTSAAREADRRAAVAWKKKAAELQQTLDVMAAQFEEAKRSIAEEKDLAFQNLCDAYEAKMTEATLQIDDAHAVGYDGGIQESEAIIAAMRQAADDEIERLNQLLVARSSGGGAEGVVTKVDGRESVLQLKEALSLKTETLASVSAEKVAVETLLVARDEEIAVLSVQLERANQLFAAQSASQSNGASSLSAVALTFSDTDDRTHEKLETTQQELKTARAQIQALETQLQQVTASPMREQVPDETRKELELWRMRALKMKKMKELVDAELQALKTSQPADDSSARIAELEAQCDVLVAGKAALEATHRAEIGALKQQVADAATTLAAQEEIMFKRGVAVGSTEANARMVELQERADRSYEAGFEAATWAAQKEIDLLRTEIALVRAGSPELADAETEPDVIWSVPVPVLGDEFSDTDAMSHSIDNLSAVFGGDASAGEGDGVEGGSEAWDPSASVSDGGTSDAARDDWGEW